MAILHSKNCAFVHIPKAGGTTILSVLSETYTEGGAIKIATNTQPHEDIFQIKMHLGDNFDKYFKFGFVRNPWDRAVSIYTRRYKTVNPNGSFKDFLRKYNNTSDFDTHASSRPKKYYMDWFFDPGGNQLVDFIGRFESFERDLKFVCEKIGVKPRKIPHLSVSDHKHYTEYYDQEGIDIISRKFEKDIEFFGYKFKE